MKVIITTNKIKKAYFDVTDIHFTKECNTIDIIQKVYNKDAEIYNYSLSQSMITSIPTSIINNIEIILHEEFEPIADIYDKGDNQNES